MLFLELLSPVIEIVIIAIIIDYLLSFFWNTRSMDLIFGLMAFFMIFVLSTLLPFHVLNKIMLLLANVAVIAIIVIFQPELRVALSRISLKSKKYKEESEFDRFLDQLAASTYRMSEKQMGALIVLEKDDNLDEFAKKAVMLNAEFSSELLESIFARQAALHDGAVIIRDKTILSASAILPLAEAPHVQKNLGTRHRAGVGLSLVTDAIVIVVSEETGKVSIARDGIFTKGVKLDRFKSVLKTTFCGETENNPPIKKSKFFSWG